jgi:hypothetical protein
MRDPEFIALRNKVLIGLIIFIIFLVLIILILHRFLGNYSGKVYDDVINDKTFVLLQVSNDCEMCESVEMVLDEHDIKYEVLTMSPKDRHEDVYRKLGINASTIKAPALFYIKKGEVVSYLSDIDSQNELDGFINNYLGG